MGSFISAKRKATHWDECYPLGNGNIGVMDDGGIGLNTLYLNDDTMWSGYFGMQKHNTHPEGLKEARELYDNGDLLGAELKLKEKMLGGFSESYLPLGKIKIIIKKQLLFGYNRKLDLSSAVSSIDAKMIGDNYSDKSFVSFPSSIYAKKIEVAKKRDFRIIFETDIKNNIRVEGNRLFAKLKAPENIQPPYIKAKNAIDYGNNRGSDCDIAIHIDTDGKIQTETSGFSIVGASKIIIYYTSKSSFLFDGDRNKTINERLDNAVKKGFDELKIEHIADYKSLYDRVELNINGAKSPNNTKLALKLARLGVIPRDGLAVTLFDFGRYLMIASERQGSASNLQGIWNKDMRPAWSSNYTININTQMNYWGVEVANMPELHNTLFDFLKRLSASGEITAKETYGMSGWVAGHNSDIYAHSNPVGGTRDNARNAVKWGYYIGSAGWLCYHLYEHYLFTMDKEFIQKTALPIIEGSVRFYLDYLYKDANGEMIPYLSTSPENCFRKKLELFSLGRYSTHDVTVIKLLLKGYLFMLNEINTTSDISKKVEECLALLPKYKISEKDGKLLEWDSDYEEIELTHRHLSHLYGIYPAYDSDLFENEKNMKAVEKTLKNRGMFGTGWSIAWKIGVYARMKQGEKAYEMIRKQLRLSSRIKRNGGVYSSLLCAHPPFQIDGNFGYVGGVIEMLVQSHNGKVETLPALPKEWKNGSIKGVKIRGNKLVDLSWKDGKVENLRIYE